MQDLAILFYKNGFNCSQCILKAAEKKFNISLSKETIRMCSAINNGFGVESICSVLVSCIMVLGLIFDAQTAKALRIKFLNEFNLKYGSLNCPRLKALNNKNKNTNCEEIISGAASILEKIILLNKAQKKI